MCVCLFNCLLYRWVCTSGSEADLLTTDALAQQVLETMMSETSEYDTTTMMLCEHLIH